MKIIRYADLKTNDITNGEGVCVSFWTQGCPFHCHGCHNPETWDFNGGIEEDLSTITNKILNAISDNGIKRNFSILGGEPLCDENIQLVLYILEKVRYKYPDIKIFLWTGYTKNELFFNDLSINKLEDELRKKCIEYVDTLITGRYKEDKRDITLKLRGSTNQEILLVKEIYK